VGISGNATDPAALRALQTVGILRIPDDPPLFHPKIFLFYRNDGTVAWIGSTNLSRSAFQQNVELVCEFEDDGSATRWFEEKWTALRRNPSPIIDQYERAWSPASFSVGKPITPEKPVSQTELRRLAVEIDDWPSFVRALRVADRYWKKRIRLSVDGEMMSWLNTITLGTAIVTRESWRHLSKDDYRLIMGIEKKVGEVEIGYGLLGSMKAADDAKNIFNEASANSLAIRRKIRDALQPVIQATPAAFPDATAAFMRTVFSIGRIGGGTATRLIALARPDLGVSVNRGSRDGLAAMSKLPASSLDKMPSGPRARSYVDLLRYLMQQPWYSNPTPRNEYERTLASARAALLDSLVYRVVS
jgi:hypothetical protein